MSTPSIKTHHLCRLPVWVWISLGLLLIGGWSSESAAADPNLHLQKKMARMRTPAPAAIQPLIDNPSVTVVEVTSPNGDGLYRPGQTLQFQVRFSAPVMVTGTPPGLIFNVWEGNYAATYVSGDGTDTLVFAGEIPAGCETEDDLDAGSLAGTLTDTSGGSTVDLTLPTGPTTPGSLSSNKELFISDDLVLGGNGNPLWIFVDRTDLTLQIRRLQNGIYQRQYFDRAVPTLRINNEVVLSGYADMLLPGVQTVSDGRQIRMTIQASYGGQTAELVQTVSYQPGDQFYQIGWSLKNFGPLPFSVPFQILYGGDTYFGGDDASLGHWDPALNMVYLTNPDPTITGIMGLQGVPGTLASSFMEAYYGDVWDAMAAGTLSNTVFNEYHDAGYALCWNREGLGAGETWSVNAVERWTTEGFLQVLPPAETATVAGRSVDLTFTVANYDQVTDQVDLAILPGPWPVNLLTSSPLTLPSFGQSQVQVRVQVPAEAAVGATQAVTLTATSTQKPERSAQASTQVRVEAAPDPGTNHPPTVQFLAPVASQATVGTPLTIRVAISDADGDRIIDQALLDGTRSLGSGRLVSEGVWEWSYVADPIGQHSLVATATDARGGLGRSVFPLAVLPPPDGLNARVNGQVPSVDPIVLRLAQPLRLDLFDGRPPYALHEQRCSWTLLGALPAGADLDDDGTADAGQVFWLEARQPGEASLVVTDAAGAHLAFRFIVPPGCYFNVDLSEPPVLSKDGVTRYNAICPGTFEGIDRLIREADRRDASQVRIGAWDALLQGYIELPDQPAGGFIQAQGFFLAARDGGRIDFRGNVASGNYQIPLLPGWNFVGIPVIQPEGKPALIEHRFADLLVSNLSGATILGEQRDQLIGTQALGWDALTGTYKGVDVLHSGRGYWIANRSADPDRQVLFLCRCVDEQVPAKPDSRTYATRDLGTPPAPGTDGSESTTRNDDGGKGGCGQGSALACLMLLGFALIHLRRRA